jgi:RNA recognition motif-containing protein
MTMKLYVGNLAYSVRDEHLLQRFAAFGEVISATVMMGRDSGRSKGFGFVEMARADAAQASVRALNGQTIDGRAWVVNEARPREERPATGGMRRNRY